MKPVRVLLDSQWVFVATGRHARAKRLIVGVENDYVEFVFVDEQAPRTVMARRFLQDFRRCP